MIQDGPRTRIGSTNRIVPTHRPLISALAALSIAALTLGCGHYRKTESGDAILASTWSDGSPIHLVQHYVRRSDYVGLAPHIVDPTTETGRLALLLPGGGRIEPDLIPWNAWGRVTFAMARPGGRGFVVGVSGGAERAPCLLISITGTVGRCSIERLDQRAAGAADVILFRDVPHQTIQMFDVLSGTVSEVSDTLMTLPWSDQRPCAMDYAALSPDRQQWVIACLREGRYGLWLKKRAEPPELLTSDAIRLPGIAMAGVPILEYQRFTLAWSPDMRFVYYCDGTDGEAVIIRMRDRRVQRRRPCLASGTISDVPYRIVGSLPTGQPGEAVIDVQ